MSTTIHVSRENVIREIEKIIRSQSNHIVGHIFNDLSSKEDGNVPKIIVNPDNSLEVSIEDVDRFSNYPELVRWTRAGRLAGRTEAEAKEILDKYTILSQDYIAQIMKEAGYFDRAKSILSLKTDSAQKVYVGCLHPDGMPKTLIGPIGFTPSANSPIFGPLEGLQVLTFQDGKWLPYKF